MNANDLQVWLEERNAQLTRVIHPQGYAVVIVSLADVTNGVQVVCSNLEKGILLAQSFYDLPRADRMKMAILGGKEMGKC